MCTKGTRFFTVKDLFQNCRRNTVVRLAFLQNVQEDVQVEHNHD